MRRWSWTSSTYLKQGQLNVETKPDEIIQEIYPLTSPVTIGPERFQYAMGSAGRFSEIKGRIRGRGITCLLHRSFLVVFSVYCMLQTGRRFHPVYRKISLDPGRRVTCKILDQGICLSSQPYLRIPQLLP